MLSERTRGLEMRGETYYLRQITPEGFCYLLDTFFTIGENADDENKMAIASILAGGNVMTISRHGLLEMLKRPDVQEKIFDEALGMRLINPTLAEIITVFKTWLEFGDFVGALKNLLAAGGQMMEIQNVLGIREKLSAKISELPLSESVGVSTEPTA